MRLTDKKLTEKILIGNIVKLTQGEKTIYLCKDNYFDILNSLGDSKYQEWELSDCEQL